MAKKSKGGISFGEAYLAIRYGIGPRRNEVYASMPDWVFKLYFALMALCYWHGGRSCARYPRNYLAPYTHPHHRVGSLYPKI